MFRKRPREKIAPRGENPAVVYGNGESLAVSLDYREFKHNFHRISENVLIELLCEGKSYPVVIRDYQSNPVKGRVEHLDFYVVNPEKPVSVHVPVELVGRPVGVTLGGIIRKVAKELLVECLPKDIPDAISVNIEEMNIGSMLSVADLKELPPGVKVKTPKGQGIVGVLASRASIAAATG